MDTCNNHFTTSRFRNLNKSWWDGSVSWKNKYTYLNPLTRRKTIFGLNYPVQLTDAFHFFKMFMILFVCISIITFRGYNLINGNWINFLLLLFIYGFIWNTVFSLFYNKILRVK